MMNNAMVRRSVVLAMMLAVPAIALTQTAAPPNAVVYIISPKDGDTVTSPFKVQFGLSGMELRRPVSTSRIPVTTISSSMRRSRRTS